MHVTTQTYGHVYKYMYKTNKNVNSRMRETFRVERMLNYTHTPTTAAES